MILKLIIFLVSIVFLEACSLTKEKNEFSGNWYTCGKDGLYDELLIKGNKFKQSASNGIITQWCEFKIKGDTFTTFDPYKFKDSVVINKAKITFVNKNEIMLDYITSDEHWTFYRLDESINNVDDNDKLGKSTNSRSLKYHCPDLRTKEEKMKDSLERGMHSVKFQF